MTAGTRLRQIIPKKIYRERISVILPNNMKTLLPLLLIALIPSLCASARALEPASPERLEKREAVSRITYLGGDGSSFEKAVVITGAKSSMEGVPAERKWLKKKYGHYEKLKQRLVKEGGKYYDLVTIRTKEGKELVVYFDISGFFNREG